MSNPSLHCGTRRNGSGWSARPEEGEPSRRRHVIVDTPPADRWINRGCCEDRSEEAAGCCHPISINRPFYSVTGEDRRLHARNRAFQRESIVSSTGSKANHRPGVRKQADVDPGARRDRFQNGVPAPPLMDARKSVEPPPTTCRDFDNLYANAGFFSTIRPRCHRLDGCSKGLRRLLSAWKP